MRCPKCGEHDTRVVDSRDLDESATIRRRRECNQCATRFTTYERIESARLTVVKSDGRREEFDRDKLASGLAKALTRRPVAQDAAVKAADEIEASLRSRGVSEVPSRTIGEMAMESCARSITSPTSASPASTRASRTSSSSSARSTTCWPSASRSKRRRGVAAATASATPSEGSRSSDGRPGRPRHSRRDAGRAACASTPSIRAAFSHRRSIFTSTATFGYFATIGTRTSTSARRSRS